MLDPIPKARRDVAAAAIKEALGSKPVTTFEPFSGGASGALIYRMIAGERSYLLRLESVQRGGFRDPHRAYRCMRIAADAEIAPALHYADPQSGVAIMDFVACQPLASYPGGPPALMPAVGEMIARLQGTPAFPMMVDYFGIDPIFALLRNARLFAPGRLDPYTDGFERIRAVYSWNWETLVSSHNDVNPGNLLFDGTRLWLIDWEMAFRNDPMADVAIAANAMMAGPELEDVLLQGWLQRPVDRLLRAKLLLMRQMVRLYYAGLMLSMSLAAPPAVPDDDMSVPAFEDFVAAVERGELVPGKPDMMHIFGKINLDAFLKEMATPGFEEALAIVKQG